METVWIVRETIEREGSVIVGIYRTRKSAVDRAVSVANSRGFWEDKDSYLRWSDGHDGVDVTSYKLQQ